MGQGGAATSGRGLTGLQVAAALRVTAASQLQRFKEREGRGGESDGEGEIDGGEGNGKAAQRRHGDGKDGKDGEDDALKKSGARKKTEVACREHAVQSLSASGAGAVTVAVTEYAPEAFRRIRAADDVAEAFFADEWTLPEERLTLELGEGRSQALFLKSKNMAFMCKMVAKEEVDVLLSIITAYAAHTSEQPNSLLMRFYMLLKVQVDSEVGYILCFNDVFGRASTLNEKWDIKGRVPKPGKFQYFPHLVRDVYAPDPYLIDTPRDDAVSVGSTHKDKDVVLVTAPEDKQKLATHKDKELTRLFWLDKAQREKVVNQLLADFAFLSGAGLMDYSILIGVSYNENKTSRSGKRYVVIKNMKISRMVGSEDDNDPVEVRPCSPRPRQASNARTSAGGADREDGVSSAFAGGIHSLFDQEIYYIGVIDMLTKYSGKKKIANFCKSFLWHEDTLSTIPPKQYEERIARFTKIVFPVVVNEEATAS